MSEESGTAVFSASSPSDVNVQLPKRRSKISYSREFLLSLAKADDTVKLPREVKLSFPCFSEDASGLLSPPFCVPDSGCHERVTLSYSVNIMDNANHLLHRSNEPYRPPCMNKALPLSSRDGKDLLNSDTPGSAESTNQDKAKAEGERWRKGTPLSISPPVEGDKQSSSCSSGIDGRSNSSFELCLPDEESLICFDGPFLMPDVEKLTMVDDSMSSSAERSPFEVDMFSPSSPREMIEKLVESLLNDESCDASHLNDPIVHHGAGLEGDGHLPHAQHSYTQFCSNHLNLQRDERTHSSFQKNSIDSAMSSSAASQSLPSSTACQSFALSHDELRRVHDQLKRVDNRIGPSKLQKKINTGKRQLDTLSVSQVSMAPLQNLNSMQSCTLGYQDPRWSFL